MFKLEHLILTALFALMSSALVACDGGEGGSVDGDDIETSTSPLEDGGVSDGEVGPEEIADTEDEEILYPGYPCGGDQQCSTGLCYGLATSQGAFEAPRCQSVCLEVNDFRRYCDSDDDCCKGRCCVGCGAREGLCVLD